MVNNLETRITKEDWVEIHDFTRDNYRTIIVLFYEDHGEELEALAEEYSYAITEQDESENRAVLKYEGY